MEKSLKYQEYLKKIKKNKILVLFFQLLIITCFLIIWEVSSNLGIINSFLFSKPSSVYNTLIFLFNQNNLFNHIFVTFKEVLISFMLASLIGFTIASMMWFSKMFAKVIDPYLTILNSLPKVALGPLIIIWIGANPNSIIFMSIMITLFITIINMYQGFTSVEDYYIILLKTFNATKIQIFKHLIVPANKKNIINCLKVNISMSLIGVIMGELLVSKEGLGYLIMYGSQVFNINLVITGVFILAVISYLMYAVITYVEKKIVRNS